MTIVYASEGYSANKNPHRTKYPTLANRVASFPRELCDTYEQSPHSSIWLPHLFLVPVTLLRHSCLLFIFEALLIAKQIECRHLSHIQGALWPTCPVFSPIDPCMPLSHSSAWTSYCCMLHSVGSNRDTTPFTWCTRWQLGWEHGLWDLSWNPCCTAYYLCDPKQLS